MTLDMPIRCWTVLTCSIWKRLNVKLWDLAITTSQPGINEREVKTDWVMIMIWLRVCNNLSTRHHSHQLRNRLPLLFRLRINYLTQRQAEIWVHCFSIRMETMNYWIQQCLIKKKVSKTWYQREYQELMKELSPNSKSNSTISLDICFTFWWKFLRFFTYQYARSRHQSDHISKY